MLAWPVAAEMALQTVTMVVDMAMVGRLGPDAVAAVGLSFRPVFFIMSIFLGVGAGTTALVARFIGAGDRDLANRTMHQSLLFSFPIALVLTGILGTLSAQVIDFMGAEPGVLPLGALYVRTLSPGLLFAFLGMVATSGLRGAGDTRTPMRVNAALNVLNIGLNYVLIFGHLGFPALGVQGAALGTALSRGLGGLLLVGILFSDRVVLSIPLRSIARWDSQLVLRILRVGFPAMMERALLSSAMVLHLRMLATQGTTVVAASTLSMNIEEISFLPAIGLSVAASTTVGQMLGAGEPDGAEKSGWQSSYLSMAFMGFMGLLFLLIPHHLLAIYGAKGELLTLSVVFLQIVGLCQIPMALSNVFAGGLRGAGDTTSVMIVTLICTWAIRLGFTYVTLFVLQLGPVIAFYGMLADWAVRAVFLTLRFRGGSWKEREV